MPVFAMMSCEARQAAGMPHSKDWIFIRYFYSRGGGGSGQFDSGGRLRRGFRKTLVEVRGQVDEVGDGNFAVVIDVAVGVGCVGFAEVGGEGDEIGNCDLTVAIQVALEHKEGPVRHG